jgi:cytochrome c-type biogenesis protein CcmH
MRLQALFLTVGLGCAAAGCDRNIEPFDASERPEHPDLSRIFPEGAERAARAESAGAPGPPGEGGRGAPPASAQAPVAGSISVADALQHQATEGAVLFVIARNAGGGPPLAVKRIPSPSFPVEFELGPDDRMIQQLPFVGPLTLSARLDSDGNATTRTPGDLEGRLEGEVPTGSSGIRIELDQVVP